MDKMVERYGSEEAVREEMARRQLKSRENYSGTGGFAHLKKTDPAKLKRIAKEGANKRYDSEL